jgi:intracellular sulfur oxidation DsrE/DsrF family protein
MFPAPPGHVARRGFLFRLSQAAAGLGALVAAPGHLGAAAPPPDASPAKGVDGVGGVDAWIDRLTGENKTILHVHEHFMTALVDARTMLANSRDKYGVPEGEFSLAVVTHGNAIQGLFRDDAWQRFALGSYYKVNDPKTGAPATRNVYLTPQDGEPADAAVPDLMTRGVTFVVCDVALRNLSKRLPAEGLTPETLHGELAAALMPGAFLVPDVFVSMQRAQKRGVAYLFTDRSR